MMVNNGESHRIILAESDANIIGMCSVQTVISTAEGGPATLVEDVVVKEGWQGQGIGKKLLAAVETWCAQRGIKRLQLLADYKNQPALDFYAKLGWQKTQLIGLRKFVER
jgi:GNAT superfamily N-acetyltransferase